MGAIKDIVDLARELETRAKGREDIALFHRLNEMIANLREQHVEIQERDVQLIRDNEDLRRKLAEANAEEVRIHSAVEFRRGKRTGNQWMPFCPKCHMPAVNANIAYHNRLICAANCGFQMECTSDPDAVIGNAIQKLPQ